MYACGSNNTELLQLLIEKKLTNYPLDDLIRYRYFRRHIFLDETTAELVKYFFPEELKNANADQIIQYCVQNGINIKDLLSWAVENVAPEVFEQIKNFLRQRGIPIYKKNENGTFVQEIKTIGEIPTYVFATDKNYLQPTRVAIHSLASKTPGKKRIIILKTTDFDSSILDFFSNGDVHVFQWDAQKLMDHAFILNSDLAKEYNIFWEHMNPCYRQMGISIRALFPVLFDRNVLEGAGYLKELSMRSKALISQTEIVKDDPEVIHDEELINNFVWLDGDLLVMKNLNDLYQQFSVVKFNVDFIPQVVVATNFPTIYDIDEEKNWFPKFCLISNTSGGVVGWNLQALRLFFNKEGSPNFFEFFKRFNSISTLEETEERFINFLNRKWSLGYDENCFFSANAIYDDGDIYALSKKFNAEPNTQIDSELDIHIAETYIFHWDDRVKPWEKIRKYLNRQSAHDRKTIFNQLLQQLNTFDEELLLKFSNLINVYNEWFRTITIKGWCLLMKIETPNEVDKFPQMYMKKWNSLVMNNPKVKNISETDKETPMKQWCAMNKYEEAEYLFEELGAMSMGQLHDLTKDEKLISLSKKFEDISLEEWYSLHEENELEEVPSDHLKEISNDLKSFQELHLSVADMFWLKEAHKLRIDISVW